MIIPLFGATITYGSGCLNNGSISVIPTDNGDLSWVWSTTPGGAPLATATLAAYDACP